MAVVFGKVRSLSDLKNSDRANGVERSRVPILCIDDQGLQYEDIIRTHDFNIRTLEDIVDINAVKEYPVIICDIKGVGKAFGSEYQGGHIIEEIKKRYPEKVVIAYTGQQFDARFNKYFSMADFTLTKDVDSDTWVSTLDQTIRQVLDPIEQWKRIQNSLLDNNIPLKQLFLLEQEYIEAVLSKDKNNIAGSKAVRVLQQDAKQIVLSFIASSIFKMVVG